MICIDLCPELACSVRPLRTYPGDIFENILINTLNGQECSFDFGLEIQRARRGYIGLGIHHYHVHNATCGMIFVKY